MRPVNPRASSRTLGPVVALGMLVLLALLAGAGLNGYRDLRVARQREQTLEAKIEEARDRVEKLEERIHRLRDDPATLERLAREELGLVRSTDVVIVLPETNEP